MTSDTRIRASSAPHDAVFPASGFVGVAMLDTRFPRWKGDVGHPASFGCPVVHRVVPGAWPSRVVASAEALRASGLASSFLEVLRSLEREGACALTTSCGFLVLLQDELQAGLEAPLVTSSLLRLPGLLARERRVGVLTISSEKLGADHLLAAGVARDRLGDVVVQGVDPTGEFASCILGNAPAMDRQRAALDVVRAAGELHRRAPDLRTVVLECTNMPPYAQAVASATGMRVVSLLDDERLR